MKSTKNKLTPKFIRFDSKEKYTRLFSPKNDNAISFRSGHIVLKEGENIGEHSTGGSEEILIILEGEGQLCINKSEKLEFEKDTVFYVPPNTVHDVMNLGRGLLKYIFVASPTFSKEG